MIRLGDLLDRYGEAIVADLGLAGWDVVELYEQGRWLFALTMIDHLPRTSSYANALAQDDELAEMTFGQSGGSSATRPLTEWTPEVEVLAGVFDRLADVANFIVAGNGGKPTKVQPYPRPVTAFDRVKERQHIVLSDRAIAKAFPSHRRSS